MFGQKDNPYTFVGRKLAHVANLTDQEARIEELERTVIEMKRLRCKPKDLRNATDVLADFVDIHVPDAKDRMLPHL